MIQLNLIIIFNPCSNFSWLRSDFCPRGCLYPVPTLGFNESLILPLSIIPSSMQESKLLRIPLPKVEILVLRYGACCVMNIALCVLRGSMSRALENKVTVQYSVLVQCTSTVHYTLYQGCPDRGSRAKFDFLNKFSWLFSWLFGWQTWAQYKTHLFYLSAVLYEHKYNRGAYIFDTSAVVNFQIFQNLSQIFFMLS